MLVINMLKNKKQKPAWNIYLSFLVFLFCYALIFLYSLRPLAVYDVWWHLKMGQDFLASGLVYDRDHYSFTHLGSVIRSVPFLFQLCLAELVNSFGLERGLVLVRLIYISILFISFWIYFRLIKASWLVIFMVLPLLTYFVALRDIVRPEILSNVFIVICISLYLRALKSFNNKTLLPIAILLFAWTQYHTPVLGYVVIFGLFLDVGLKKILAKDDSVSWKFWLSWGMAIFFMGFKLPEFHHFLPATLSFMGQDWSRYIGEYSYAASYYEFNRVVNLSWMLSLYVSIWSLIKKRYGFAFISLFLLYFSLSSSRLVAPAALINLCLLAFYLGEVEYEKLKKHLHIRLLGMVLVVACFPAIVALYYLVESVDRHIIKKPHSEFISKQRYPLLAANFLKQHYAGGKILHRYRLGGFLIYQLAPNFQVYIDGRTNILYSLDFMAHYAKMIEDKSLVAEEIEKFNIDFLLKKNTPSNFIKFQNIAGMDLVYADDYFLLFSRQQSSAFPLSSRLLVFPMCWRDELKYAMRKELNAAASYSLADNSLLVAVRKYLLRYMDNKNQSGLWVDLLKESQPDSIWRISAYQAYRSGEYELAGKLFRHIRHKHNEDYLMLTASLIGVKNYASAEQILAGFYALRLRESGTKSSQRLIFVKLLLDLKQHSEFDIFTENDVALAKSLIEKGGSNIDMSSISMVPYDKECASVYPHDKYLE